MDLHISMDMNQEALMDIISQLDSALILPSPITPPSQQLLPSDPFYVTAPCASPQMPVRPPAATMEHVETREMIYRAAAMRPVCVDMEKEAAAARPRRRNVRISSEPQSVAARLRRERVSQRMRVLQRLVPGGTRMDTASMLDEAIRYVKFLKSHVQSLEQAAADAGTHGSRHVGVLAGEEFYSCPYFV